MTRLSVQLAITGTATVVIEGRSDDTAPWVQLEFHQWQWFWCDQSAVADPCEHHGPCWWCNDQRVADRRQSSVNIP
jgi:hypothetical protein